MEKQAHKQKLFMQCVKHNDKTCMKRFEDLKGASNAESVVGKVRGKGRV